MRLLEALDDPTTDNSRVIAAYGLPVLGSGAGRNVFLLNVEGHDPSVLKVARYPHWNLTQNTRELACLLSTTSSLAPEVYAWGPPTRAEWVEEEYLSSITWTQFARRFGLRPTEMVQALPFLDDPSRFLRHFSTPAGRRLAKDVLHLVAECHINPVDLHDPEQWGLDMHNRLKLRDLGLSGRSSRSLQDTVDLVATTAPPARPASNVHAHPRVGAVG